MTRKQKRIILLNLPYVFIGLIATDLCREVNVLL